LDVGIVGLGRMGGNMARRLSRGGHRVVGFDVDPSAAASVKPDGVTAALSLAAFVQALDRPRGVWTMLPAGQPTEDAVVALADLLEAGDTILDGGNSYYKDSMRRAESLRPRGLELIDVGISGGILGLSSTV